MELAVSQSRLPTLSTKRSNMNILIYGFSGKILGGIETFILNMNEHMSKDCIFDYIIDGDVCVYKDRIKQRGGSIFFVPGVRRAPIGYIKSFYRILKEQKNRGTNVLYIQLFSMCNILPVIIAKKLGYKVILHSHNNGLQSKGFVYTTIHRIGKCITSKMELIRFTNSKLSSDFMFGKNIKSELIYNAIDTKKFSFSESYRLSTREEMSSGNNTVIGFVGRLEAQKNPLFMLKVYAEYHQLNPQSELWIVGEGNLKGQMIEEINKSNVVSSVKWLGRRNDVEKLMSGMDLLLQPSIFEGLGIVLIEGQATGLPCVTTDKVVPPEAKASKILEFVNLNNSPRDWAKVCLELVYRKGLNDRNANSSYFEKKYDIDYESTSLEFILNSIDKNGQISR